MNAETCIAGTFGVLVLVASKTIAPGYRAWADTYIENVKEVLGNARTEHKQAVLTRIEEVSRTRDVVTTTKTLFDAAKETALLEARGFEEQQRAVWAREAKDVLDSWVRYEAQMRKREQQQMAEAVVQKVNKTIATNRFKKKYLANAVKEAEQIFAKA